MNLGASWQAALAQEQAARARAVQSLRESIVGLRAAGAAERRLRAELASSGQQLAAARAAQVPNSAREHTLDPC